MTEFTSTEHQVPPSLPVHVPITTQPLYASQHLPFLFVVFENYDLSFTERCKSICSFPIIGCRRFDDKAKDEDI